MARTRRSFAIVVPDLPCPERTPTLADPTPTPHRYSELSTTALRPRSPLNPENSLWVTENQRRTFAEHLRQWSLNHDTSIYLNGFIQVRGDAFQIGPLVLGKSVACTLVQPSFVRDHVKHIVIKLFPPRGNGRYRLIVRSGASWVSAREFFDKQYFVHLQWKRTLASRTPSTSLVQREAMPLLKFQNTDGVKIRPLFSIFLSLPFELQLIILEFAFGKIKHYCPGKDKGPGFAYYAKVPFVDQDRFSLQVLHSPSKLSSLLSISKSLNSYLLPWVYSTINFAFGCQGLTNFLWMAGPENRKLIKNMTLVFKCAALTHCIRWMCPDPIHDLFNPRPIVTRAAALQSFWRFSIRDLARDLNLRTLTVDVDGISSNDIPLIVHSLRHFFGNVEFVRYTCCGSPLNPDDIRLAGVSKPQSWGEICRDAFTHHLNDGALSLMISDNGVNGSVNDLEKAMESSEVSGFFESSVY